LNLIRVMPAKGLDASFAQHYRVSVSYLPREILVMDNIITPTPKVTTGPLPASGKVYVSPASAPDLRVPLREIELSAPSEPRVRVYDTTGPYTDPNVVIDVRKGLARTRRAWVLERGGVEEYDGRPIQAIDNGNVKGSAT
jgi:phosphomethylpyrimidine synthase